jgi:Tfp pilus assembly protein PilX
MMKNKLKESFNLGVFKCEQGFILIAGLTLLTALVLLGTTAYILSSTDIKIGGNFRNSHLTLQAAMAGAERAREVLRALNASSAVVDSFSEELLSRVGTNLALDGYSATTDDVALASGTVGTAPGTASYVAYLTNDSSDGVSSVVDSNKKVVITSVATGPTNSQARVETVVNLYTIADTPAAIYAKGDVTGNGSSLTISGIDFCGAGGALAPIYTKDPSETDLNGTPILLGNPPTAEHGSLDIDIGSYIDSLKKAASVTLTADQNGGSIGSSTNYQTVYSWPDDPANFNNQGLKLQNLTGYGTLLVKGDLELGGGFTWYGPILATGAITLNGGGGAGINIYGKVLSGTSTLTDVTVNGSNTITYDSCQIKKAMAGASLKVATWKQSY